MTNIDFSPKPYRIERRLHIGQPWMLVDEADSHDEALRKADASVDEWDGYARVVVQHVIHRCDTGTLRARRRRRRSRAAA